ncbi:YhdP family protein [Gimibacter soli]|uniref:AsmA-like C-terminal domain-containing protein n=1 Tax=Gimibacter soli TaxID=3024400 RepID=A0AAE9XKX5_9PROT|nr:AsmA-like C-terminal domain-containing protein [Gimibacter soli]WCL52778.1 AsmA-like C-terminal domain-containing protein [Gimibacter soli]
MLIRSCMFAGRALVWAVTLVVVIACLVTARLVIAPIDLGFARGMIEARVESLLPGWHIKYDSAEVGWDWRGVRPWVEMKGVAIDDGAARGRIRIPEMAVGLSRSTLLGNIGIATVRLDRPNVHFEKLDALMGQQNGPNPFKDLMADGRPVRPDLAGPFTHIVSGLASQLMKDISDLSSVEFRQLHLTIAGNETRAATDLMISRITFGQDGRRLDFDIRGDLAIGDMPASLGITATSYPEDETLDLMVRVGKLVPAELARHMEAPEVVSYFDLPVDVQASLSLSTAIGLESADVEVSLGDGRLSHVTAFPDGSPVPYGEIRAYWQPDEKAFEIEKVEVAAGKRVVKGDGLVYWVDASDTPGVQMNATIDEATIPEVLSYWPIKVDEEGNERGARVWVKEHISKGTARRGKFEFYMLPDGSGGLFDKHYLALSFSLDDVTTSYLNDMAPVSSISGRGLLTEDRLDIAIDRGVIMDMPLYGSRVLLTDIDVKNGAKGQFDIRVKGGVDQILALVTPPPVRVADRIGIDLARLGGEAELFASIKVPLIKDMPADAVRYDVAADITDARVSDLLGGEGIRNGALRLELDNDRIDVAGDARFNGVPMRLHWKEDFAAGRKDAEAETTLVELSGRLDHNGLKAFGLNFDTYINGDMRADASFTGRNFKFTKGSFKADVTATRVMVPELAWAKAAGVKATAAGLIEFEADGSTRVAPMSLKGDGIDADALFIWGAPDTGRFELSFDARALDNNRLSGIVVRTAGDQPYRVEVAAERLDLSGFLGSDLEDEPVSPAVQAAEGEPTPTIDLSLHADRVDLLNGETLQDLQLDTLFLNGAPTATDLTAILSGGDVGLTISADVNGDNTIRLKAADGGAFVRGLGYFSHLDGGALDLSGETSGWGRTLRLDGEAKIAKSLMVPTAKLDPAVQKGTMPALDKQLGDDGIPLDQINMKFRLRHGLLDIDDLKANGASLGVTLAGQVDAIQKKVNVNGVIVPAYGINAVVGKIPLIGAILTGGEGKGVIGITYRVKGMTDNPEVSVNALSGLAPGFLRFFFEGAKGKVATVKTPDAPPAAEGEAPKVEEAPVEDLPDQEAAEEEKPDSGNEEPAETPEAPTGSETQAE